VIPLKSSLLNREFPPLKTGFFLDSGTRGLVAPLIPSKPRLVRGFVVDGAEISPVHRLTQYPIVKSISLDFQIELWQAGLATPAKRRVDDAACHSRQAKRVSAPGTSIPPAKTPPKRKEAFPNPRFYYLSPVFYKLCSYDP
jgi:hypothetical protein